MATITGTDNPELLQGGNDGDTILALGGDDSVWGGAADDSIDGGDGDDQIDGGGGGDTLHGGAGNDYINGESFSFGDGWADALFGDDGDDMLDGLDGDDTLNGGDGQDIMLGYGGDDRYNGGAGADYFQVLLGGYGGGADVVEDFTDGEDRVLVAFDGLTAPTMDDIESIVQDGADTLITIINAGTMRLLNVDAATIDVNDFFFYQDGSLDSDTLQGGGDNDLLKGEAGDDALAGLSGLDELNGGAGRDRLMGGKGSDILVGGEGRDMLAGGKGADTFRYEALADGRDRISDFSAAAGDVVDLSAIDANAHKAGDQTFHFVQAFTGHWGEVTLDYHRGHDRTVLALDADGDGTADMVLKLDGHVTADAGWIL